MEERETMGRRIAALRRQAGLSQEALARVMGLSRMTIANWEQGKTEPSASQVKILADIFGVTTDQLLGRKEVT